MKNVIALARRVAMGDSNVLITGESGTGKELVARALHFGSPRKDGPFVAVNCAQFAPSLLESELFGHEKGAFTGATQQRRGRFELADGGTLFLDEVGNTGSEMQARILRVLETGTFERVGGEEPIQSDFRLLAATNTDLDKEVQEGRFRKDLYYRLHVVPIHIPPLRERREDILPLCEHAISLFRARTGRSVKGITPEAQELLVNWDWPGNVRELCNAIEMALTLEDGEWITSMHLPVRMQVAARVGRKTDGPRSTLEALMEDFEKQLLAQTLRVHGWSHVDAARSLGIHRNTIENKIKRYGIMPDGAGLDAG
jgi:DNA-binding NtrC family response regulator